MYNNNKANIKSSYDESIESSEGDFDMTCESIESNCTNQSPHFYYHRIMLNKAEEKKSFLNESSELQHEYDLINKQFYLQQIECKYIVFFQLSVLY